MSNNDLNVIKNQLGIEELKDLIRLTCKIALFISTVMIGGKLKAIASFILNIGQIKDIYDAYQKVDFNKLYPELKDLSEAESEELKESFINEFQIPYDMLEKTIESIFEMSIDIYCFVKKMKSFFNPSWFQK